MSRILSRVNIGVLCMFVFSGLCGAATVSVLPTSIDQAYQGWIDVTISGIPVGATAMIELIADFDRDGVVDTEDGAINYYPVTDGVSPPVSNSVIAGDQDGEANGTIQARLGFWEMGYPVGRYNFRARGTWGSATTAAEVTSVSIAQSVSGTLKDAAGQPIRGAVLAEDLNETGEWLTLTNDDGTYTLYLPRGDTYEIWGFLWGKISEGSKAEVEVDLSAGQHVTNVDLTLSEGSTTISGRVYDVTTGLGLEAVQVMAECWQGESEWESEVFTNSSGQFCLPVLPGNIGLAVNAVTLSERGYVGVNEQGLTVTAQGVSGLLFPLQKADAFVTGRVYRPDTGAGVSGIELGANGDGMDIETYSVENGQYALALKTGQWSIQCDDDRLAGMGLMRPKPQQVQLTSGQNVSGVDLALGVVSATVNVTVQESGGDPVEDLWVWMNDENWNYLGGNNTNSEGKAVLSLKAGLFHIGLDNNDLFDDGYAAVANQTISLATGEVKSITFTLQQGFEVSGTVTRQSDGTPIDSAWIGAYDAVQEWEWKAGTETQADGTYKLFLSEGTYRFQANADNYFGEFYSEKANDWNLGDVVLVTSLIAPVTGVDFTLEQSGTLEVTVKREDNQQAVTTASVSVYTAQGSSTWQGGVNETGVCTVDLSPGSYKVMVEPGASDLVSSIYYDGKNDLSSADSISLVFGETTQITVWASLPAQDNPDGNSDGFVDEKDLLILQKYWHQSWPPEN